MFEIVNNRQIIFGENKTKEICGILKWYHKKKYFFLHFQKMLKQAKILSVC